MTESAKRAYTSAVKKEERENLIRRTRAMKKLSYSNSLIARQLKISESSVRELLKESE